MATHLLIFVKDGNVRSVLSDFQGDMQCLIVRANDEAHSPITGEPWIKPMDFPEADGQQAVLEPIKVESDPDKVRKILSLGESSRHELLKLLS